MEFEHPAHPAADLGALVPAQFLRRGEVPERVLREGEGSVEILGLRLDIRAGPVCKCFRQQAVDQSLSVGGCVLRELEGVQQLHRLVGIRQGNTVRTVRQQRGGEVVGQQTHEPGSAALPQLLHFPDDPPKELVREVMPTEVRRLGSQHQDPRPELLGGTVPLGIVQEGGRRLCGACGARTGGTLAFDGLHEEQTPYGQVVVRHVRDTGLLGERPVDADLQAPFHELLMLAKCMRVAVVSFRIGPRRVPGEGLRDGLHVLRVGQQEGPRIGPCVRVAQLVCE